MTYASTNDSWKDYMELANEICSDMCIDARETFAETALSMAPDKYTWVNYCDEHDLFYLHSPFIDFALPPCCKGEDE